jgi:hypothetical protein
MEPAAMTCGSRLFYLQRISVIMADREAIAHTRMGGLLQMRCCQNCRIMPLRGNNLELRWTWRRDGRRRLAFGVRLNFDGIKWRSQAVSPVRVAAVLPHLHTSVKHPPCVTHPSMLRCCVGSTVETFWRPNCSSCARSSSTTGRTNGYQNPRGGHLNESQHLPSKGILSPCSLMSPRSMERETSHETTHHRQGPHHDPSKHFKSNCASSDLSNLTRSTLFLRRPDLSFQGTSDLMRRAVYPHRHYAESIFDGPLLETSDDGV